MMTAKPTAYAGTQFRSRLEARWAAFFDLIGWEWVYEPLDTNGYIPDFLIRGAYPLFVEVGPCVTEDDYIEKAIKPNGAVDELQHDLLVVGVDPRSPLVDHAHGHATAGLFGQFHPGGGDDGEEPEPAYWWESGAWTTCATCGATGVVHSLGLYTVRPCGHYPGGHVDRYVGRSLDSLWREAGTLTRWLPRPAGTR